MANPTFIQHTGALKQAAIIIIIITQFLTRHMSVKV